MSSSTRRTGTPGHSDYRLEIYPSRGRMAALAAAAGVFVALCLAMAAQAGTDADTSWGVGVVAVIGIAFFGLGVVYALRRLIQRTPALLVDATGVHDRASLIAAGTISWDNIAAVDASSFGAQRMLTVAVHDTQAVLDRHSGLSRLLLALNSRLMATPVNIPALMLSTRLSTVASEINAHLAARWAGRSSETDDVRHP